jgi:hypothetical protein
MTPRSLVTALALSASPAALLGCGTMPEAACDKRGDLDYIGHDFDHDGRCDRFEVHTDGVLVDEILDLDSDGKIDLHRTYQDGRVVREQRR